MRAVQKEEKAYTSASTAENQNVSLHVYANAPHTPLPNINAALRREMPCRPASRRRAKWVMVQNSNNIVAALRSADMALMQIATLSGEDAKLEKNLAVRAKNGLPGGCPTSIR